MSNPYLSLVRTVWHYGKRWRYAIVINYLAFIIAQAVLSLSPYSLGKAIDVLQHFKPERLKEVILWLALNVVVLLLFWMFHGPARILERKVALKLQQSFRLDLYQNMTRLPLKWHQNHHSGNTITRVNRASMSLYRFAENQFVYIETIVKFITSIAFLLWISLPVGLMSVFLSVTLLTTILLFDRKLIPLYDGENEIENHVGAVLFDYISNMTTVLTLRLGELTHSNLFQRLMAIWPIFKKEAVVNEVKWFTVGILLAIAQAVILIGYIIHELSISSTIMIGVVVMIFRYQWELGAVFFELSMHYGDIVKMDTDVKSVDPILEDIENYAYVPQGEAAARQWHTIEITDLAYHHHVEDDGREQIFENLNFKFTRGEKIALIGMSGGGKSTLLNLLCGLYTPLHVKLKVDGIEFDTLEPLQAITTLIPQDPEIFENTIAFNITMDLPTEPEEIHSAIQLAGFSSVLEKLPLGLETDIREKGLNFSVGQKQRLALARGLFAARYSSLILMDEPTSSVDLPTEKTILSGIIDTFPESALIVSLHRLHLLPKFDTIIMLSHGEVVASGPVSELLSKPGPVYDLWQHYQQD
ncbi:MAG: ABC transporter ATP-binding protein/permease [Gammaproteobacteria bacterium]|nr:ABC transporter ATP-binding protein/permease [Gammaproteobacteria bacterium]